jgi:hypothetical protein
MNGEVERSVCHKEAELRGKVGAGSDQQLCISKDKPEVTLLRREHWGMVQRLVYRQ